ncbi:serine hydrolase [Aureococcus anophagefferens]|uniref:Serine hydrolase n=1 Tax=Aureococcus anophagefferens TaxID=44056 RepID=A0ABR1FWX3_AURAN
MGGDRGRGRGARGRGYSRGRRERKRNNDDDRNRNNDDGARRSDLARRVLCLHGSEQTGTLFAQRLAPLAKRCGDSLVFVDAPHALPLREGQTASLGWWRRDGSGFDESLDVVRRAWRELGPFSGLLGFSSGGALAPSAGKSTFFNAVTRSTGALAAKCAAYPFTTIDPNVREGLFACGDRDPALGLGLELAPCPPHGRDAKGRRLLPALLKDVAGLVPGASRGEGKGNRFLNDLADADALVHVVDASAETDASGGAVDAADAPEDALAREIAWIREELHRWIAGNVARKWHSVVRLAKHRRDSTAALDRLLGLFTGYAAAPVVVRRAIAVAGLDERVAALDAWGSSELHRLVAAFLEIRFPTVVVLNKCDRPSARANVERLGTSDDLVPCSAAVEAGLVAARARGDVSYVDGAAAFDGADVPGAAAHLAAWGTTGVLDAVSRAVALARPAYAYPVADLDSLAGARSGGRLADCVVLRPHATVEDVFTALKRRGLGGDFVRADVISDDGAKRRQAKARDPVGDDCRVVKVATNRKNPWQRNL